MPWGLCHGSMLRLKALSRICFLFFSTSCESCLTLLKFKLRRVKIFDFIWSKSIWKGTLSEGAHGNPLQCSCLENPHGQRSLVGSRPWGSQHSMELPQQGKDFYREKKKSRTFLNFYKLELSWLWLAVLMLCFLTLRHLQTLALVLLDFVYIGCHSIRSSSI